MKKVFPTSFFLTLALLTTSSSNTLAQTASSPSRDKNIRLKICGESLNWKRPTYEEQKKHLLELHRYSISSDPKEIDALLKNEEYWNKDIFAFTTYPGGSGTYEIEQLSGLWAPMDSLFPYRCEKKVTELNDGKVAEIWTLNYKVISVGWNGSRYVMRVKRVSQGTQNIHFPRREHREKLPLSVIDEDGKNVSVAFE